MPRMPVSVDGGSSSPSRSFRTSPTKSTRKVLPLIGAAFGAGVALAKILDWRGHAHPRI